MPLWLKKLMLFIIQRSSKKITLTTGGLFDASLEGFTTVRNITRTLHCGEKKIYKKLYIITNDFYRL